MKKFDNIRVVADHSEMKRLMANAVEYHQDDEVKDVYLIQDEYDSDPIPTIEVVDYVARKIKFEGVPTDAELKPATDTTEGDAKETGE